MNVVYGLDKVQPKSEGAAVAVGVFDGVHWGHRAIFDRLIEVARENRVPSIALTFDRHPAELLAPAMAPNYICTLDQRIELIAALGVEEIVVAEFNRELAELTPELFLRNVIRARLGAKYIVVGSNFRFGKNREGDIRYLSSVGPTLGIGVHIVPSVIIGGGPVSSTRVRALIGRGDVEDAAKLLGRYFALRGTVVPGRRMGREIGFPTANIETSPRQLVPARGVYAVESTIGKSTYKGVCNIGTRPTFGNGTETIEVHFMGFRGNIYGQTLDVVFHRRLRDEMVFESPEKLAEQIRRDLERVAETGS